MKQQISALMDGEPDALADDRCLDAICADAGLRNVWETYHLIGDLIRGEPGSAADATARFAARLASEPTVLVPGRGRSRASAIPMTWAAAAAVAGVGVVVWAAVGLQPERSVDLARVDPARATRNVAMTPVVPAAGEGYLLAHQGVSPSGALIGFSQYARTVAAARTDGAGSR